jgi:hypothetical protein
MNQFRRFATAPGLAAFSGLGIAGLIAAVSRSDYPLLLLSTAFLETVILRNIQDALLASSSLGLAAYGTKFVELGSISSYFFCVGVSTLVVVWVSAKYHLFKHEGQH